MCMASLNHCWIMPGKDWVQESAKAGRFLPEETYGFRHTDNPLLNLRCYRAPSFVTQQHWVNIETLIKVFLPATPTNLPSVRLAVLAVFLPATLTHIPSVRLAVLTMLAVVVGRGVMVVDPSQADIVLLDSSHEYRNQPNAIPEEMQRIGAPATARPVTYENFLRMVPFPNPAPAPAPAPAPSPRSPSPVRKERPGSQPTPRAIGPVITLGDEDEEDNGAPVPATQAPSSKAGHSIRRAARKPHSSRAPPARPQDVIELGPEDEEPTSTTPPAAHPVVVDDDDDEGAAPGGVDATSSQRAAPATPSTARGKGSRKRPQKRAAPVTGGTATQARAKPRVEDDDTSEPEK
ncbi:hypothetical protein PAPYR_9007 [Paratrimastix pyriformis]|uniref:Uncharacterized protein n=1 Tax=Paratrimastix pyriformis TaxID=342808 RepID=A0ABQ8UE40_9EUKA|nr:hypothetical protein PAPYR_9007 [Paratrimastix pyriformis]